MAYQALYRVWRSQKFSDIIGQTAISQTLKNAIANHKTSHAYLFTGPRGTGKTSAAKIFAKAINCPHQVDGEPCNVCEICLGITAGKINDVIEIDAASNNGVDEIRELRDKVKYAPTQTAFKVYIIDEVHMLSTGAFNALLKTLEEPPESVIFILATTEPHKIPATIISRTQRFDFKKIEVSDIVPHLKEILDKMNVPYEDDALLTVALAAEGGMRDALSILDQTIAFSGEKITQEAALVVTGSLSSATLITFLQQISDHDVEKSLATLANILQNGKEPKRLVENVMNELRDVLMYQQSPAFLNKQTNQITPEFIALTQNLAPETIYTAFNILNETQQNLRFTNAGRLYLEVMTVKLATIANKAESSPVAPAKILSEKMSMENKSALTNEENGLENRDEMNHLQETIKQLQQQVNTLSQQMQTGHAQRPQKSQPATRSNTPTAEIPKARVYEVLKNARREDLQAVRHHWEDLLQILDVTQRAMLKAGEVVAASKDAMVIAFDYEFLASRAQADTYLHQVVSQAFDQLIGQPFQLVAIPKEAWPTLRKNFIALHKDELKASSDSEPEENAEGNMAHLADEEVEVAPDNKNDQLVEQAVALFGTDLVEVLED
ncbi:DNA polymerase III subunit gamma/tau [Enterococcus timonensis]|uniref:DNA polymerase III subunit gamma/tau n=1 Tax=Enterococcus timonensis TaxID=1852364 RepID=UPI0008DA13EB|nr:DNA polymerase III subunit gamma/tau [Enterococcus timonensis]